VWVTASDIGIVSILLAGSDLDAADASNSEIEFDTYTL